MKKHLLIIGFIFLGTEIIFSQSAIQWQKTYGGSGNDYANDIAETNDGGFILAGVSASNDSDVTGNHGGRDYWIVKTDITGSIEWQKSLGGSGDDEATCIQQTFDSGYIISGFSKSSDGDVSGHHGASDSLDCWIVKTDSVGNIIWQQSYGGTGIERAYSVQQTADTGYIVAGYANSINGDVTGNHGYQDFWIIKLNESGIIEWQKSFGGTITDEAYSITQTSDTGFIVVGFAYSGNGNVTVNNGQQDIWVVKLNATGTLQWQKSLGGTDGDEGNFIIQTNDGNYVIAGYSESNDGDVSGNHGSRDFWIVKIDSTGNILWQQSYGGSGYDEANSISETQDGGLIIAGISDSNDGNITFNNGNYDYWVFKTDSMGNIQWQKSLGGSSGDGANSVRQTSDGGYIITGISYSNDGDVTNNKGGSDFWAIKLSSFVNAGEIENHISDCTVFPNPFDEKIKISFFSKHSERIRINISDITGRTVKNLESAISNNGYNEFEWDRTNDENVVVTNGIYLLSISSDFFMHTERIVLVSKN